MKTSVVMCVALLVGAVSINAASVPPQAVEGEGGCHWSDCTSPFTYSLKCPPDFTEEQENDKSSCEGNLVKYRCCPNDPSNPPPSSSSDDSEGSVIPQPV